MTAIIQQDVDRKIMTYGILDELYQSIDEIFLAYFISLAAPCAWRPHLENYEGGYRKDLQEEGVSNAEIERCLAEQEHIFF
jgi:hypothetical protein